MTNNEIQQKLDAMLNTLLSQSIKAAVKECGQDADAERIAQTAAWWHEQLLDKLGESTH